MLLQAKNRGGWDAQYLETQEMRYTKRAPAFIILPDETPGGKPLWKALCEVGQASCSLQKIPGSARTSFIRAHQNHVDVHSISSGTEQKRKLQKRQHFVWCLLNSFANTPSRATQTCSSTCWHRLHTFYLLIVFLQISGEICSQY